MSGTMIDVVVPETRLEYAAALMEMHHDRKRVFVDRLGWSLPSPGSWLEVDEFDNDHAIYLLARSEPSGRHQGSVRLLPSTRPHMLQELFAGLCADAPPVGEDIWEISRLVTSPPEIAGTSIVRLHRLLALGLLEFALLNSIRRYTLVTEPHRVPALLSIGWTVRPLGLPAECMGQMLQALQITIDPGALQALRSKARVSSDVLRFSHHMREAA
jgi:N-acyl-L-homoserine lactone synthetase